MKPTPNSTPAPCPICNGLRWVCEDHPDKPWQHDGCGGAGAPCVCNPEGVVEWREVFADNTEPPERPN